MVKRKCVNIGIERNLHKKIKILAIQHDWPLQLYIEELIKKGLEAIGERKESLGRKFLMKIFVKMPKQMQLDLFKKFCEDMKEFGDPIDLDEGKELYDKLTLEEMKAIMNKVESKEADDKGAGVSGKAVVAQKVDQATLQSTEGERCLRKMVDLGSSPSTAPKRESPAPDPSKKGDEK